MYKPELVERAEEPSRMVGQRGFSLRRLTVAEGHYPTPLAGLSADLSVISSKIPDDEVSIRDPRNDLWKPRVEIMTMNAVFRRKKWLGGVTCPGLVEELRQTTSLADELMVQATGISTEIVGRNEDAYIHLRFSADSSSELQDEHHDAWATLADLADIPSERIIPEGFVPEMRIAYVSGKLSNAEQITTVIENMAAAALPLDIRLAAALPPKSGQPG
jgi:hypothetical protein